MENIALIGIDLGKNSFHIHCQDRRGKAVYRKKFTRPKLIEFLATCPATTIAMEACGGRDADLVVMVDCQIPSDDLIVHFF